MKSNKPFFVGYLTMPATLRKFYWPLAIALMVGSGYLGYSLAANQKSPVQATWNTTSVSTMEGILTLQPYAVLNRIHPEKQGQVESVLLVAQGKHGAGHFAQNFDGHAVSVTGNLIQRGGWTMLEIADADAISGQSSLDEGEIRKQIEPKFLGEIELSGRIADSKCFLGVMKPGAGRVHRACAEVCVAGGIPPMLIAQGKDARKFGYVLADAEGFSATENVAGLVAQDVQIRGKLVQRGDIQIIWINPEGVERI